MLKKIGFWFFQVWSASVGFLFLPLFISKLGIVNYGLLGFLIGIQAWVSLLDFGLNKALARVLSFRSIGSNYNIIDHQVFKEVFTLVTLVNVSAFFLIGLLALAFNQFFSSKFEITSADALKIFIVYGGFIAIKNIEAIYTTILMASSKQFTLSALNFATTNLRIIGSALFLVYVSNDIVNFIYLQFAIGVISLCFVFLVFNKANPTLKSSFRMSFKNTKMISAFGIGNFVIGLCGLFLMQLDKIFLPLFVSSKEFGVYILAFNISSVVFIVALPIGQVFYRVFLQKITEGDFQACAVALGKSMQILAFVVGAPTIIFFINADIILSTIFKSSVNNSELSFLVRVMLIANFLNCLLLPQYNLQIAAGKTQPSIVINVISIIIFIPLFFILSPLYGVYVPAVLWLAINLIHITFALLYLAKAFPYLNFFSNLTRNALIPLMLYFLNFILISWISSIFQNDSNYGIIQIIINSLISFAVAAIIICSLLYKRGVLCLPSKK